MAQDDLKTKLTTSRLRDEEQIWLQNVIKSLKKVRQGLQYLRKESSEEFEKWKEANLDTLPHQQQNTSQQPESSAIPTKKAENPILFFNMGLPKILDYEPGDNLIGKKVIDEIERYLPQKLRKGLEHAITAQKDKILETISDQPKTAKQMAQKNPDQVNNVLTMILFKLYRAVLNEQQFKQTLNTTHDKETRQKGIESLNNQHEALLHRIYEVMHDKRRELLAYFNKNALLSESFINEYNT